MAIGRLITSVRLSYFTKVQREYNYGIQSITVNTILYCLMLTNWLAAGNPLSSSRSAARHRLPAVYQIAHIVP
jgi:hypothetical protein